MKMACKSCQEKRRLTRAELERRRKKAEDRKRDKGESR